jgi:DNA primase
MTMPRVDRAGRIDTETLKRQRPLADVIATYPIALRRESAGTYRALCPFHQEQTPSFWIDARDSQSEHYWCFGCGAHGDVITFVMTREGCSFREACERLAASGRPPVLEPAPRTSTAPVGRRWEELNAASVQARVLDDALRVYQDHLWQSRRAGNYLRTRGVSETWHAPNVSVTPTAARCCAG